MYLKVKKSFLSLSLKYALKLHSAIYKIINRLLASKSLGDHPKHKIVNYNKWFCDRVGSGDVVIDIGCHIGNTSSALSQNCRSVIGIDIDENRISTAKRLHHSVKNLKFECLDVTSERFHHLVVKEVSKYEDDTEFKLVLSNVLEHIEDRVNFLKSITTSFRNKKVRLLIRVPDINRDWIVLYKKQLGIDYLLDPTHFIEFTKTELEHELTKCNIAVTSYENMFGEHYLECVHGLR